MKKAAEYRKPIAGILTGIAVLAGAFGFDVPMDGETVAALAVLLSQLVVTLVPNRPKEGK